MFESANYYNDRTKLQEIIQRWRTDYKLDFECSDNAVTVRERSAGTTPHHRRSRQDVCTHKRKQPSTRTRTRKCTYTGWGIRYVSVLKDCRIKTVIGLTEIRFMFFWFSIVYRIFLHQILKTSSLRRRPSAATHSRPVSTRGAVGWPTRSLGSSICHLYLREHRKECLNTVFVP